MATITKRSGKWQARVRRKGFSTQTKTFSQKGDAERWVRQTEIQIETHELPRATPIYPTFEQAVTRYKTEVSIYTCDSQPQTASVQACYEFPYILAQYMAVPNQICKCIVVDSSRTGMSCTVT